MNELMLLSAAGKKGEEAAKGVSFDGTSDYLSRSSDLVGNTDSKTFTFSCWLYLSKNPQSTFFIYATEQVPKVRFQVRAEVDGDLWVVGQNSSGTGILSFTASGKFKFDTFNHILVSCDMGSTSNRHVYMNDVAYSATWNTYADDTINFTAGGTHTVAAVQSNASLKTKGRLSNLYLDYTYRDLSIEANRRLFITEDLKPA